MADEPFTPVGRIARTHGLKGEVSVIIDHDTSLDALLGLDAWIVPPPQGPRATRIVSIRPGPKGPLVTLAAYDSIDSARELTGRNLLVKTEDLPDDWKLEEEDDLVGTMVRDEVHGPLGEIEEVIETGANDVWVVNGPLGQVLIPVIDDVLLGVDEETDEIVVRLLPGLLPSEGEEA